MKHTKQTPLIKLDDVVPSAYKTRAHPSLRTVSASASNFSAASRLRRPGWHIQQASFRTDLGGRSRPLPRPAGGRAWSDLQSRRAGWLERLQQAQGECLD